MAVPLSSERAVGWTSAERVAVQTAIEPMAVALSAKRDAMPTVIGQLTEWTSAELATVPTAIRLMAGK